MSNLACQADNTENSVAKPSPYGCAEFGAPWADAECAVVILHGRDRDADELPNRVEDLPVTRRARLLAPFAASRSWYPDRYDAPLAENAEALSAGLGYIHDILNHARTQGVAADRLVLAGFSQGGCMTIEYLMAGHAAPAAAAIFTGSALDLPHRQQPGDGLAGLPVVLTGGSADPWLPISDLMATGALLEAAGADVQIEIFPDGEHAVRDPEILLLGELIEKTLA